jgi:precorrin-6B methylase 2
MEMAEKFPDCKIIAIGHTHAALANIRDQLANVEFRECVIDETHTGMESIESDTVDYVMMKDCWFINSPSHKWTNVLDQAFRILKPNGWIELSENGNVLYPTILTMIKQVSKSVAFRISRRNDTTIG